MVAETQTHKNTVLRNIVRFSSSNLYRHILGFITALFRPGLLGPELYGLWSLLNVIPMYASYAHLGARTAMRYLIPQLNRHSEHELRLIKQNALLIALSVNGSLSLLLCAYAVFFNHPIEQRTGLLVFALVILLNCLYEHYISELKGYQNFRLVSYSTYIRYGLNFLFTLILIFYFGFYGALAALLLSLIFSFVHLRRHCRLDLPKKIERNTLKKLIKMGSPIMALDLIDLSLKNIDKLLVFFLMGSQSLGFYAIASMLMGPIMNVPGASREVTEQQLMSKHHQLSVLQQIELYLFKPMRYVAYLMPILIVGVYFCLPTFIHLVLPQYQEAIQPTRLLMIGAYFLALSYPCRGIIVANNWQKRVAFLASFSILISSALISCSILFNCKLVGVAISSGVGFFSLFSIFIVFIFNQFRLKFNVYLSSLVELFVPFTFMLILLVLIEQYSLPLSRQLSINNLCYLLMFLSVYVIFLYFAYRNGRFTVISHKALNIKRAK